MMNEPLEFIIHMTPVPKGRPRFANGIVYTPQETVLFESAFRAFSRKYKPYEPLIGPLDIDLEFHFVKPKSSKRIHHTVRPDIDNLQKAVTDAMNNLFYKDDAQIIRVRATKFYSEKEFIRIVIKEFSEASK